MLFDKKYTTTEKLYESSKTIVIRSECFERKRGVILKYLKAPEPNKLHISRFKREYEIVKSFNNRGIVKVFAYEQHSGTHAIVMEDIGADSLLRIKRKYNLSLIKKIEIAIKIAYYIDFIHSQKIIHMDINPSNIVCNLDTDELQIIDFGISTDLQYEKRKIISPDVLEGTLPYISPEQTGRMNRYIDYRTDIYSFGVTLYELFAGRLPFLSKDPLKLIHSHIAKRPEGPKKINKDIPRVISEIILKLISKDPEDRYKKAAGVAADMEQCLSALKSGSEIDQFKIGDKDSSARFIVPQRIYGRKREIKALADTLKRVSAGTGSELFLIGGRSGVGKTSIVSEILKLTPLNQAIFIQGKFEKGRKTPYSALKSAFSDLLKQKLSEPNERIEEWKNQIIDEIRGNAKVLINLIPEMEILFGEQPALPPLPAKETENRNIYVYQKFLLTCCAKNRPLALFIDDLQWSDVPTMNFIEKLIVNNPEESLLIVGAYRDNEVKKDHPLINFIKILEKEKIKVKNIKLNPLTKIDITKLIKDTVGTDGEDTDEISGLIRSGSEGIPFEIKQILHTLYQDKLIWFNREKSIWEFDKREIFRKTMTRNRIEQVMAQFIGINKIESEIISTAACLGNFFDLNLLASLLDKKPLEMAQCLEPLVDRNIIYPSDNYKYLRFDESMEVVYYFTHDRIWQQAYNLRGEKGNRELHLAIGNGLLERSKEDKSINIFDVLNHLNRSADINRDKEQLGKFNYEAGKRAKETAAWKSSLEYLTISISMLGEDVWANNYDVAMPLYMEAAESAYLVGEFDHAKSLIDTSLENGRTDFDKCRAYKIRIDSLIAQGRHPESVKLGLDVLTMLKVKFPKRTNNLNKLVYILKTYYLLKRKKLKSLPGIKTMDDERLQEACKIMMTITSSAYIIGSPYFIFLMTSLVSLFIKKGYHAQAPYGCTAFANVICGVLHDYEFANELGSLAIELAGREQSKFVKSKVVYVTNAGVFPWKQKYKELLPMVHRHYKIAKNIGDLEFSGFNLYCYSYLNYLTGANLSNMDKMMSKYSKEVSRLDTVYNFFRVYHQTIQNLIGKADKPYELKGNIIVENDLIDYFTKTGNRIGLFEVYSNKLHLCYLFGKIDEARKLVDITEGFLKEAIAKHNIPTTCFYQAMTICAIYSGCTKAEKRRYGNVLKKKLKKMGMWAESGPDNFKCKYHLLSAEIERIYNNRDAATTYYKLAIEQAEKIGVINDIALAHELTANHYLDADKQYLYKKHLLKAHECYKTWGAYAKSNSLEENSTDLFASTNEIAIETLFPTVTTTTESCNVAYIDLLTAMKCSQLISSKIELDKLLEALITNSVENAGAEKGCLITKHDKNYVVQAHEGMGAWIEVGIKLTDKQIAKSAINYVENTKKPLLLGEAHSESGFCEDIYIKTKKIKSLLCLPYIYKEKILGYLYLENNQAVSVFSDERIKILQIIASQAVVSIENANLYGMVADSEKRYRSIFDNAQDGIFQISPDGVLLMANSSLNKMFRLNEEEQEGGQKAISVSNYFVDKSQLADAFEVLKIDGIIKNYEADIIVGHNHIIRCMINVQAINGDDGKIIYYEGNIKDITEQKQVQELTLQKKAAEAEAKAKSNFMANMSHDIRTPINTILGFSELLKENLPHDPILTEYIGNIDTSGKLLLAIINEILDFSKIESGKVKLKNRPVTILGLFEDIVMQFEEKIREKGLEFNINTDLFFKDLTVKIDEVRFKQVIINIIDNAYKYTESGHVNIYVKKNSVSGKRLNMSIIVEDTGPGVTAKEKIFEAFEQIDVVEGELIDGAGLGLSIVKKLVEIMGATVEVQSKKGHGTEFKVNFPNIEIVESAGSEIEAVAESRQDIVFEGQSVVVADDNTKNRSLIKEYAKNYAINIIEAKNGREAIEIVEGGNISLVLMDIKMPVMNGIEATKMIRKGEMKDIPIIAITADIGNKTKSEAVECGFDLILLKPIGKEALIKELMKHLSHSLKVCEAEDDTACNIRVQIDYEHSKKGELLEEMQALMRSDLEKINKTMIISDISKFAGKIKSIGMKYKSNYLEEWGKILERNAVNFKNRKTQEMLNQYPALISTINDG